MITVLVCRGRKPYPTAVMADVVCGGESVSPVAAAIFTNARNDPMEDRATMGSTTDVVPMRPWQWWVSGLLLLATMLNSMDRQTLANLSVRITEELSLSQERYGDLELAFGWPCALRTTQVVLSRKDRLAGCIANPEGIRQAHRPDRFVRHWHHPGRPGSCRGDRGDHDLLASHLVGSRGQTLTGLAA